MLSLGQHQQLVQRSDITLEARTWATQDTRQPTLLCFCGPSLHAIDSQLTRLRVNGMSQQGTNKAKREKAANAAAYHLRCQRQSVQAVKAECR